MSAITQQGYLSKVRRDLEDVRDALSGFYDTPENDFATSAYALHDATEALLRAVSTLTLVVEAQEQGQIAQLRQRDDCASHYGTFMP